jgi:LysM repeat protein
MKKTTLGVLACALLILLSVQPALASAPEYGPMIHIVHWGETLGGIAARYGTTVHAIMSINRIHNPNRIYAGQRLAIPARKAYHPTHGKSHYPAHGNVYIVRRGDTLSGIACRFGVSVNALVRANGIVNRNRIYAGQCLRIPHGAPKYAPKPHYPKPHQPHHGRYYRVRRGDTLSGIAWRFGVSTWSITMANHLANPNVIYAGQKLYIP